MSMSSSDERPVAVVTGGAIRVGGAISRALAAAGYRVWIHCNRSEAAALALLRELGPPGEGGAGLGVLRADLGEDPARRRMIADLLDPRGPAAGRVDLLVNSAASFEHGAFLARSDDDLQRVLAVNLIAPLALVRGLAPALRASGGAVVNILDLASFQAWGGYTDHCIAKAGLAMATRALAGELAPAIRVNGIAPGTVLWPDEGRFAEGSPAREAITARIPLGRVGTPQDVARAVLYLAREPFINGHTIVVDGGRLAAAVGPL